VSAPDDDILGIFRDGSLTGSDDKSGTPNSATVVYYNGDLAIDGLLPGGRVANAYQGPEGTRAIRLGERAYPTISFTGDLAALSDAFTDLAHGLTSGFVSVIADMGDVAGIDLAWTADYGTSTRTATFDDCVLTSHKIEEGDPSKKSYTFTVYGPVVIGGKTIIAAR
jgi:hypothetical protein